MATPIAFTVRLELGRPEHGLWCHSCLLPSARRWPLHGLYPHGVFDLGTITACSTCVDLGEAIADAVQRVALHVRGEVVKTDGVDH